MGIPTLRSVAPFVVAVVAIVALGLSLAQGLSTSGSSADDPVLPVTRTVDQPAPELTGSTLAGHEFDLTGLRGEVVVVNVLASWCPPCRREVPLLVAAAEQWRPHGVRIIGLAMRDDASDAARLLADSGAPAMTVVADPDGTKAVSWGVRGVPETFIVDRTGRLRVHAFGPISADWLNRHLTTMARS